MKGKHVEQDPDEFCVEFESAEASEHVEEEGLIVKNARKSSHVKKKRKIYNIEAFSDKCIEPFDEGYAPDNQYSPPVANSLILFPIRVTREKLNCAFGNTVNLLACINHFNTDLKRTLLILKAQLGGCCLSKIRKCIIDCLHSPINFNLFCVADICH